MGSNRFFLEESNVLQRRWFAAFLVFGLIGTSFGQDKDKDKKTDDKKTEAPKADDKKDDKKSDDAVDLKWKFDKDKTFYQEMTTETKQTMKVMGMDITQNQKQTF